MADMTITGDARFGTVIDEMKRVERASDSMKRKVGGMGGAAAGKGTSYRSSQGLLEISRGVEDFAVAGMRGLLNNIPGIIMSLGGGMGLAAVISLAAVGVTLFGKKLLDLMNPTKKTAEEIQQLADITSKYESALASAKKKVDDFRDSQDKLAMSGVKLSEWMIPGDVFGQAQKFKSQEEEFRAARDRLAELRNERDMLLGRPFEPQKPNAFDQEADAAAAAKLVSDLKKKADAIAYVEQQALNQADPEKMAMALRDREQALAFVEKRLEELQMQAGKSGKALNDSMSYFADIVSYIGRLRVSDPNDPTSELFLQDGVIAKNKDLLHMSKKQIAEEKAKAKEIRKQIDELEVLAKSRADALEALRKEKSATLDQIESAKEAEASAKRALKTKQEELKLQAEINALQYGKSPKSIPILGEFAGGGISDIINEISKSTKLTEAFSKIDSVLSGLTINGSDMLSSSGRIGGSVAEYNSAIATINYQRESLTELRKIARNTAKRQSSTYN